MKWQQLPWLAIAIWITAAAAWANVGMNAWHLRKLIRLHQTIWDAQLAAQFQIDKINRLLGVE